MSKNHSILFDRICTGSAVVFGFGFGKKRVFSAAVYAALRRLPGRKSGFDGDAIVDSLHENRLLRQRTKKAPEICYDR